MDLTIVALHGFLGAPSDWDRVREHCSTKAWILPDYARDPSLGPKACGLGQWGEAFAAWLRARGLERNLHLVGYSQGGRLALHALRAAPSMFARASFISCQAGFAHEDHAAREARVRNDESWARAFETEPWTQVMERWNTQAVFAGGAIEPSRPESPEARSTAAACLRAWSLGRQEDLRPSIEKESSRLDWIVGARDGKYASLAEELGAANPGLRVHMVPSAGHRVPFDAPAALADIISSSPGGSEESLRSSRGT